MGDGPGDIGPEIARTPAYSRPAPTSAIPAGPDQIGSYLLVDLLGEGGMGTVWRAEQLDPVQRTVALKIIKSGMDTTEVVLRFQSERQALAMMSHPAIAQVLDGGATPEGRPYFVMEYVPGVAITDYCDEQGLTTEERLALFTEVCAGVQHAHQKAVIHRDLKPSNILVTVVDGRPQPKIIDFGIAKAIGRRLASDTPVTEYGTVLGTPEYMSPEQADAMGDDVDTRTDVYTLGVVLYELLTSQLPFSSDRLRKAGVDELRRILRETDPPAPSTRVATLGPRLSGAARRRATEPGSLIRRLRGDLDAITLRALERERSRRYGSASELAADIQRHLRHEPIDARPPSTAYRLSRYLRRHRVATLIATGVVIVLASFVSTVLVQTRRTARERDRANAEAAAAREVTEFLFRTFRLSDPTQAQGNSVTVREVLDRSSRELRTSLPDQPAVRARMMATVGRVYRELGLYQSAESMLTEAYGEQRRLLGDAAPDTLDSALQLTLTLQGNGKFKDAEALARHALERAQQAQGPDSATAIQLEAAVASVTADLGDRARAEAMARAASARADRALGPGHRVSILLRSRLSAILTLERKHDESLLVQQDAMERARAAYGPDHPDTLLIRNNYAVALFNLRRFPEAVAVRRDLLDRYRRVFGPESSNTLWLQETLAYGLVKDGQLAEGIALEREVLASQRRLLGPEHPETLATLDHLAVFLIERREFDEAERLSREALAVRLRISGSDHPDTALIRYNLACILARAGKPQAALEELRTAVQHGLIPHFSEHLAEDTDFEPLLGLPEFRRIAAEAKQRSAKPESTH